MSLLLLPILQECPYRGRALSRGRCVCHWIGTPGETGPGTAVTLAGCAGCPIPQGQSAAVAEQQQREWWLPPGEPPTAPTVVTNAYHDCPHRGAIIGHKAANLCGLRGQTFPIHHCAKHDVPCVKHRICRKQVERCCLNCVLDGEHQE